MTPLELNVILALHCGPSEPSSWFGNRDTWDSEPAKDARHYFMNNGVITYNSNHEYMLTDKGQAWLGFILKTPFPVCEWKLP